MQNLKYIVVIAVAIVLTLVSGAMTVVGYLSLYAGRTIIVSALFITLEIAKAVIFGIILVNAEARQKVILVTLAIFLICLSFIGHLSYLSKSYYANKVSIQHTQEYAQQSKESHSTQLKDIDYQIELLKEQIRAGKDEIKTLTDTATGLATANSRNWAVGTNKKRIKEIQDNNAQYLKDIKELSAQKANILNSSLDTTKEQGQKVAESANRSVFQYTADMIGVSQDKLANVINFILALVVDSLALTLLWTASLMWKKRHKAIKNTIKRGIELMKPNRPKLIDIEDLESLDEVPVVQRERNSTAKPTELKTKQPTQDIVRADNIEQFLFEGNTVQDVIEMDDDELEELKSKVRTQEQKDWLSFALALREQGNIDLKFEELR